MSLPISSSAPTAARAAQSVLRRIARDSMQVISNASESLLQNPATFKTNALVISSFILVVSRIFVANVSAVKARGTAEGPYRDRESMRTTMREIAGFTFSFGVLREVEKAVRKWMQKGFGIPAPEEASYPLFKNLGDVFKNRNKPDFQVKVPDFKLDMAYKFSYSPKKSESLLKAVDWIRGLIGKGPLANAAAKEQCMKRLYEWGPMIAAAAVSVPLAGYVLERFTRDYSNQVLDSFNQFWHRNSEKKPVGLPAVGQNAPPAPFTNASIGAPGLTSISPTTKPIADLASQNASQMDRFVGRVQQKQMERGLLAEPPTAQA